MRTTKLGATFAALSIAAACFAGPAAAAPALVAWTFDGMQRLGMTDAAGSGTVASISAARREWEPFQIGIHADSPLTNVRMTATALTGPGGATIPAPILYREHYVQVTHHSADWGDVKPITSVDWFPDALVPLIDPATGFPPAGGTIPATPFDLAAGTNQPMWADVFVPAAALPGDYSGSWSVTSDQGSASGTVSVHVWDFTLPLKPSLDSSFGVHDSDAASGQLLLDYKLMPLEVPPKDEPGFVTDSGLRSGDVGVYSGAYYGDCHMGRPPALAEIQARVALHDPRLELYNYSADEIGPCGHRINDEIRRWGRRMHAAGVDQLITMPPRPALLDDGTGSGRSAVDIWVPISEDLQNMMDNKLSLLAQVRAKGDEVWSYTALTQDAFTPKWEIDFSPMNYRIMAGFLAQASALDGLLYWTVNYWTSDPWHDIQTYRAAFPGEGMLIYPGYEAGVTEPVPSMRLAWLREGVEDYEYVQILEDRGLGAQALTTIAPAATDWRNWTQDPAVNEAARESLATQIEASNP